MNLDDGSKTQKIKMNESHIGVILGKDLWHSMESISAGCVMLIFASDYFDENDYIRNYDAFLKYVALKNK